MRNLRKNSKLYEYLESNGLLDKGTDAIRAGKAAYRRQYLADHKRSYRNRTKSHIITCKPIDEKALAIAAKDHGMGVSEYVRMSSLAYTQKKFLIPRIEAFYKLQQTLIIMRTQIERIGKEKRGLFQRDKSDRIEELLQSLDSTVRSAFHQPKDLENLIREAVLADPSYCDVLKKILAEHVR